MSVMGSQVFGRASMESCDVRRTSLVKVTFNRNSGERLAPDTHFTELLEKALQLVLDELKILACQPGHLPNTL